MELCHFDRGYRQNDKSGKGFKKKDRNPHSVAPLRPCALVRQYWHSTQDIPVL